MPISGYFDTIFASGGDLNTIPDATQPSGTVSYEQGFPVLYSTAVTSGGYNVPRTAINQVLNDITTAIQYNQQGNAAPFITTAMNGGSPYSYPEYAVVLHGGIAYQSNANGNTDTPPSSKWVAVPLGAPITSINFLAISSSGTYTPSAGMQFAQVQVIGAGGAGGSTAGGSGAAAGAGGGAGGYAEGVFTAATIGSSQTVTIGSGGAAGAAGNHAGNSGGGTSFGSLISATGGTGGAGAANSTLSQFSGGAGGNGGAGTGGTIFTTGVAGGTGTSFGSVPVGLSGAGGGSVYGTEGKAFPSGSSAPGNQGFGVGAGGSGSVSTASNEAGGAGAAGIVYITEFCSI
jgi:hypothetical protein